MIYIVKLIARVLLTMLAILGLLVAAVIIYYAPVIDRVVIRPCHYYPEAFADCH